MSKTHYRKVFKSDHLGCADLEDFKEQGSNLIFTIKHVNEEIGTRVAGKKIDANMAYFHENIKPLVLNATNSKIMRGLTGSIWLDDWNDVPVQLYIDNNVNYKGDITNGIRINPNKPRIEKPILTPDSSNWGNAVLAYKRDGNLNKVLSRADISQEHQKLIKEQSNV